MDFDAEEEDPDLPWQCPDRGWRVKFDDASAPWWKWRKLEKLWVDASFFHGSIPDFIADKWPRLRTIGLYNNELTGTVPPSLGRLTDLTQTQLRARRSAPPAEADQAEGGEEHGAVRGHHDGRVGQVQGEDHYHVTEQPVYRHQAV